MTVFHVTLTTITPLHIGKNAELRQEFDFSTHKGRTYRFDLDKLLAARGDRLQPNPGGRYPLPGRLLTEKDYDNPDWFLYVLRGEPRSKKADARLQEAIKDVYNRPYIPGSSLKGALRTALAWTGWEEAGIKLDLTALERDSRFAAQPLEKQLFGPDPNTDLLRALQVSDLTARVDTSEAMMVVNAQVLTRRGEQSPIELECIATNITFNGTIVIDETLFSRQAEERLHFGRKRAWLDELPARVQRHSHSRIENLIKWFDGIERAEAIAKFYRRLLKNSDPGQALVQIGWGAGWDSKTFWTHLQKDQKTFETIMGKYRLQIRGRGVPSRNPGAGFPTSHRVAMNVSQDVARPAVPFGWALLEMEKP